MPTHHHHFAQRGTGSLFPTWMRKGLPARLTGTMALFKWIGIRGSRQPHSFIPHQFHQHQKTSKKEKTLHETKGACLLACLLAFFGPGSHVALDFISTVNRHDLMAPKVKRAVAAMLL